MSVTHLHPPPAAPLIDLKLRDISIGELLTALRHCGFEISTVDGVNVLHRPTPKKEPK